MEEAEPLPERTINELPVEDTKLYYPESSEQALQGFTPEIIKDIMLHVQLGANLTDVANIVRLPPQRVQHWYKTNYCNFAYEVDYHRADNKRRLLKTLMQDNPKKVSSTISKAAQFLLERKYRDEYGKEIKVEVNHTMIDNITRVVFDAAVRYIKDPETLKLFITDISEQVAVIRPTEGMPPNQKMIS
jgi:hypothetical protein